MRKKDILIGLGSAMILAAFSFLASSLPDGLERVAENKGFLRKAQVKPALTCPLRDYIWPGVKNKGLAVCLSGLAGTLTVFGMGFGVALLLKKRLPYKHQEKLK